MVPATASRRVTQANPPLAVVRASAHPDQDHVVPDLGEAPEPLVGEVALGQLPAQEQGHDDGDQARAQQDCGRPCE